MRIISGTARATKLYTLDGLNTRPTLDRVKESLFNIIQNEIHGSKFLDLFSGSGAIGLEAASRGAKKVILCDNSKDAIKVINKNVEKTHLKDKVQIYNIDYESLLNTKIKEKLDIVYIDPPYNSDFVYNSIELLIKNNLVDENTKIILETDNEESIIKKIEKLKIEIIDRRKYGRVILIFLKIGKG